MPFLRSCSLLPDHISVIRIPVGRIIRSLRVVPSSRLKYACGPHWEEDRRVDKDPKNNLPGKKSVTGKAEMRGKVNRVFMAKKDKKESGLYNPGEKREEISEASTE